MNILPLKKLLPNSIYSELPLVIEKFNSGTPLRLCHFLAQCAHESGNFKRVEENLNYSKEGLLKTFPKYFKTEQLAESYAKNPELIASRVYANRMGNGDESTKDGWKYRGRGYIQLTGKSNYKSFGDFIDVDIINNFTLVATEYPLISAGYFFHRNKLFSICDKGSDVKTITEVTKRVNGGTNGLRSRITYFNFFWENMK